MKLSLPYFPNPGLFRPARTLLPVLFSPMLAFWAPVSTYAFPPWGWSNTPTYALTDLGTLKGYSRSVGRAINDFGDAVGTDDEGGAEHAFLYERGGQLVDLSAVLGPDGFSEAHAINLERQIVGLSSPSVNFLAGIGFLYQNGQFQTFTGPNGVTSNPFSINIFGQVVGDLNFPTTSGNGGINHVFLRQPTGQITDLGTFGGTDTPIPSDPGLVVGAFGVAINDLSQIVGVFVASDGVYHAFLTEPGGTTSKDLGSLGGYTWANDVNDFGQVVGYAAISPAGNLTHAFLYSGGKMSDLGTLPGGTSSVANAINIFGQIVGGSDTASGGNFGHAFVYLNGKIHDLNDLLSPTTGKGWLVWWASRINDRGQIIGNAVNALGEEHAVILTPVY